MIMPLPNIFTKEVNDQLINRLNMLTPSTKQVWGKMNVAQMLAHCNVTYDLAFDRIKEKHNFLMKIVLKTIVKKTVTDEAPYKHSLRTAPVFLVSDVQDFDKQKAILIENLNACFDKGPDFFDGKTSQSFGKMNITEWNNMFYKHLDHHFRQFGV
jgi:Protein of unknown function (DUF1569)